MPNGEYPNYTNRNRCTNTDCIDYRKWFTKDNHKCPKCGKKLKTRSNGKKELIRLERMGIIKRY